MVEVAEEDDDGDDADDTADDDDDPELQLRQPGRQHWLWGGENYFFCSVVILKS